MRPFLPDPADLRWLVRSLELRSFSAAAREMDAAVSVVSRGVDRLEAGFGITLLRRSTHGLSATPEGAELVQEASELLGRLEEMAASFDKQRHRVAARCGWRRARRSASNSSCRSWPHCVSDIRRCASNWWPMTVWWTW
jgi:DNA-binding transcriptional LysR family regulator